MVSCGLWIARGRRHVADESRSRGAGPFHGVRMVGARGLDRAGRNLAPEENGCKLSSTTSCSRAVLRFNAPSGQSRKRRSCAFDLVITNGHIIDGTGSPWYSGDIGIRDGRVAAIGNLTTAPCKRTIDAAGKAVAPGFIDMLGQSELTSSSNLACRRKFIRESLRRSPAKVTPSRRSTTPLFKGHRPGYEHYQITPDWRTFRQYSRARKAGHGHQLG